MTERERTIEPPDPVAGELVGDAVDPPGRRRVSGAAGVDAQDSPHPGASAQAAGAASEERSAPDDLTEPADATGGADHAASPDPAAEDGAAVGGGEPDAATTPGRTRTGTATRAADSSEKSDEASGEPSGTQEVAAGGRGRRRIGVLVSVAAVAYALDLISKVIVVAKLEHQPPIDVVGSLLRFQAVRNPGAAFGIGEALTVVFTVIAVAVIVVIVRIARKLHSGPWAVALGMLLGGAFGNLTDRIFRSPGVFEGHVVDFIAPSHFAVFNLADSAIVCGGILIVILSFRGLDPDGTVHRD